MKKLLQILVGIAISTQLMLGVHFAIAQEKTASAGSPFDELNKQIAVGQQALESAQAQLVIMLNQINKEDADKTRLDDVDKQYDEQIIALSSEIQAKRKELEKTRSQIYRVNRIFNDKQQELSVFRTRVQELADLRDAQAANLSLRSKEAEETSARLAKLSDRLQSENKVAQELNESIVVLKREIEATSGAEVQATNTIVQQREEILQQQQELDFTQSQTTAIRVEHNARMQRLANEKATLAATQARLEQWNVDKALLNESAAELESQLLASGNGIEVTKQKLTTVLNQLELASRSSADKQLELAALKDQVAALQRQTDSNNAQLATGDEELEQMKERLAELNGELQTETEAAQQLKESLQSTERELAGLTDNTTTTVASKDTIQRELAGLEESVRVAKSSVAAVTSELSSKKHLLARESEKLAVTNAEIERLQQRKVEISAETETMKNPDEVNEEMPELMEKLNSVSAKLATQQALLEEIKVTTERKSTAQQARKKEVSNLESKNYGVWERIQWVELALETNSEALVREEKKKKRAEEKLASAEQAFAGQQKRAARLHAEHEARKQEKAELRAAIVVVQQAIDAAIIREAELKTATNRLRKEQRQTKKETVKTKRSLSKDQTELRNKLREKEVQEAELNNG